MNNAGQKLTNGNHPKAILEIIGIPLKCDYQRLEKALEHRGQRTYKEKVTTKFVETTLPDRRVVAKLSGLQPSLSAWITEVIRQALADCGYARIEISAILWRQ